MQVRVIALPFCRVVLAAPWNEPPTRRFVAYRCREGFRRLLGHAVIDEFATLSSPIFLGPRALAGKLYNAGLSLAHRRDPELGLDFGWPPLVVGLAESSPEQRLPEDWESRLLAAVQAEPVEGEPLAAADGFTRRRAGAHCLERATFGEAVLWATDAPLLPNQLGRLCEISSTPFTLALGMRPLERPAPGAAHELEALSEQGLLELLALAREVET